jgi:hypothetical protein
VVSGQLSVVSNAIAALSVVESHPSARAALGCRTRAQSRSQQSVVSSQRCRVEVGVWKERDKSGAPGSKQESAVGSQ